MNFYHKLLDLPEAEAPPDHYGLLGVPRFTDDARVIHDALVSRNSQLKAWDNSKFYIEANALLDEVVAASFILEDPVKKAAYDTELRQRLGLSVPQPAAVAAPAKSIEESRATESSEEPDEMPRPKPSARHSSMPVAIRVPRDAEPTDTEADAPETNFDGLFLKLGGALIAVTLLIAVPLVMWSGRNPEPVATPNQTVTPPDSSETLADTESKSTGGSVTSDPPKVETTPNNVGTNPHELLTLNGHAGRVWSVAYSPDGKRLASAGDDYIVRVWDAASGRETLTLKGHTGEIRGVAFSPDGQRLASASVDWTVRVWDAMTGRELLKLLKGSSTDDNRSLAWSVAFSPDGKRLAAAIGDFAQPGMVKVWDATSGEETLTFKGHNAQIRSVVYSPDGTRLASASVEGAVKVWDAATGQEYLTLKGGQGGDKSVAFSPDGKWLASVVYMTAQVWDAASGEETLTLKGHTGPLYGVAFSPDGKRLASTGGHLDQTVRVWDATSGQETLALKGHTNYVVTVAFSPDGKQLASSSFDQTVRVWDVDQTNAVPSASPTEPKMTETPKPAPDPDWDPANVRELATLSGHNDVVTSAAFSADGKRLASASFQSTVKVWDARSGQSTHALKGHTGLVFSVAFSADGNRLASASADHTVKVWDATNSQETFTLKGHTGWVTSVMFSPDGNRLASASNDQTVKVWDTTSGQETHTLKGHTGNVHSVAFSADGKRLASAGGYNDNTVKVWDAVNALEILTFRGHAAPLRSVAFSPDGKRLVSAGFDRMVKVWDATSGQELLTLRGHTDEVKSVAFSPDGKRLASASADKTVKVWDATTGQETLTLKGHTREVWSVAFSSDGKRLVPASEDRTVKIWGAGRDSADSKASGSTSVNVPRPATADRSTTKFPTTPVQYVSSEGIVLRFDETEHHWFLTPRQSVVKAGELLACLEPYEARLSFDQGSLLATVLGDSVVRVVGPTDMAPTGLVLRRGRVIFQGSRKAAQRPIALAIVVGQDIWKLELLTPETVCAIEITPREPSGFEKLHDANWYLGTLSVLTGSARWTSAQGQALELVGRNGIVIAANQDESAVKPTPTSFPTPPDWTDAQKRKLAPLRRYASLFEKNFELDDRADKTLQALIADRRPIISGLAVRGLTLTDSYPAIVQALTQCEHEEGRFAAREGLHLWLPMAAEHGPLLRKELEALYSPAEAEAVYRLLWGFNREDGKDKATSLQLVGWLRHPNQTIRELAHHWIKELTYRKFGYRATDFSPAQRESAVRSIEALIEKDGALIKGE